MTFPLRENHLYMAACMIQKVGAFIEVSFGWKLRIPYPKETTVDCIEEEW